MDSNTGKRSRTLIVGCCNGNPGLLRITGRAIETLDKHDTRGVAWAHGNLYFLLKSGLHVWADGPVPLATGGRDWHGLVFHGGSLWATDPVQDVITEYDLSGDVRGTYDWTKEKSRLHTNDIWIEGDDLYTCCFNWGICKNGLMMELGKRCQPHSPIIWENSLFYCASNKGEVHDQQGDIFASVGGFTRGLLPTPEGLYVGSSKKRHHAGGTGAAITLYDWNGHKEWTLDLPTDEVYGITTSGLGAEP